MFFSKPGMYSPCGMYSIGHIILFTITFISIILLLQVTKKSNKDTVKKIIKIATVSLWILEIIKITFNLIIGNIRNPNHYIPLYYCSLILYAGLLSSFAKGNLKKIGDVFISTGAIVGGTFFLCCPNTSLTMYPMFHYISIQSFIFHGTMVYLGILVNITDYVDLKITDIKYYAILVSIASFISYIINGILGTNFMFISKNFPNTPVDILYRATGKFFTSVMILIQILCPFYVMYLIIHIIKRRGLKNKIIEQI